MRVKNKTYCAILWLICSPVLSICQTLSPAQDEAGIHHVYQQRLFNGGGVAFFDSDNDGDDDLYITGGEAVDHFYINNGDGTFTYSSPLAGINITTNIYTTSVNAGDFNGDGYNDLYVTTIFDNNFTFTPNLLFINQGDNTFREVWNQNSPLDKAWSMGSALIDYDHDGDLDIYTINYIKTSNPIKNEAGEIIGYAHECYPNRFYENRGNLDFREISAPLRLNDTGCGLAVMATDYDLDGDVDLYLANDFGEFVRPNQMFRNEFQTEGMFVEEGESKGTDIAVYGMGIAKGDVDGDQDDDLYVTNFGRNVLLLKNGDNYTDGTTEAGVENTFNQGDTSLAVSWGTNFLDIDNDGDLDLYVANGYAPTSALLPSEFPDADQLYYNDGTGMFTIDTSLYPASNRFASRGTAFGDYDNDGDLDIFTVVFDRPSLGLTPESVLYKNQGNTNNWIKIKLEGRRSNFNAFGARARLFAGEHTWNREVSGGSSHCSHNSQVLHYGLGSINVIDSLHVFWPGNLTPQGVYNLDVNQSLTVVEDTTGLLTTSIAEIIVKPITIFPNPTQWKIYLEFSDRAQLKGPGTYELIDIQGRSLWRRRFDHFLEQPIDLGIIENGQYFLRIATRQGAFVAPIQKVR